MTKEEWQEVNSLLFYLRSFHVPQLVQQYFEGGYGNSAPTSLLELQMDKVQKLLDTLPREK